MLSKSANFPQNHFVTFPKSNYNSPELNILALAPIPALDSRDGLLILGWNIPIGMRALFSPDN